MKQFEIFKYNFDTAIDVKLNFMGYRYLSIYTDGLFNPNLNSGHSLGSEFYVEDSLNNSYDINQEIYNLKLNAKRTPQSSSDFPQVREIRIKYDKLSSAYGLSGGYGNIFVVLSVNPFYQQITKNFARVIFNISNNQAHTYIWIGENAPNMTLDLKPIGFLNPHAYVEYYLYTNIVTGSVKFRPYNTEGAGFGSLLITMNTTGLVNTESLGFRQYIIDIDNGDAAVRNTYGCLIFKR